MPDPTPAAPSGVQQDTGTDYDAAWDYEAALDNLRGVNDTLRQEIATLQRERAEASEKHRLLAKNQDRLLADLEERQTLRARFDAQARELEQVREKLRLAEMMADSDEYDVLTRTARELEAARAENRRLTECWDAEQQAHVETERELVWARAEIERLRTLTHQAFDAIDNRHLVSGPKKYTRYPCECGAMVSNSGHAASSHRRGTIHHQNMERKALGLEPI